MPRPEDIPGTQDRGVQAAVANHRLALFPDLDIALHHRRGMSDADVDKVTNACPDRRGHGLPAPHQIDAAELRCFGWAGMGNADQLYESRRRLHLIAIR